MPSLNLGGGFGQGFLEGKRYELDLKKMKVEEAQVAGQLMKIDQDREKFRVESAQKSLADSIARMKALADAVKAVGPNFKPGSSLDKAIDVEKGILAKVAKINGLDENVAWAAAEQARAFAMAPQEIKGYGAGQTLIQGGQVIGRTPDSPTSFQQNVQALAGMGIQPSREELTRGALGGGVNVNVDTGTIPPGYRAERDAQGRVTSMAPIPGGPAATKQEAEGKAEAAKTAAGAKQADLVAQDIKRALDLVGMTTTGFGATLKSIPATNAKNLSALLNTIKSSVGFQKLQQMRDASPTGGALGNVSNVELELLQATLGSLDQSQSPAQLRENLQRLQEIFLDIVHGPGNRPGARTQGQQAPAGQNPYADMTDEQVLNELRKQGYIK